MVIFLHPQIPDIKIVVSRPNHTSMERLFIQLSDDVDTCDWLCGPGSQIMPF